MMPILETPGISVARMKSEKEMGKYVQVSPGEEMMARRAAAEMELALARKEERTRWPASGKISCWD